MAADTLSDFTQEMFSFAGTSRSVYRAGEGTAVIVMAEIPGITPKVADFARRVIARGHTVFMPVLFGSPGAERTPAALVTSLAPACISKEFNAFAFQSTPPAIDWLRALARHAHQQCGGPGVGAVGMCFTGGFALAMATDPTMLAPVLSQPSLPLPFGKKRRSDVGCSPTDLATVIERTRTEGLCVLGLRFTGDAAVPAERFSALSDHLGESFIGVELDSSKGNPWGHKSSAHSVLTEDLVDKPGQPTQAALLKVLDFLDQRLSV
ncbi:MAG: dienelactone hydrolase family protein [Microthrixaceae bacterium]